VKTAILLAFGAILQHEIDASFRLLGGILGGSFQEFHIRKPAPQDALGTGEVGLGRR